ncbi:GNAT family N-acetyltransferase [Tsukamurella sp. 1534]|uniref:GNAT family N-acetyltransferase n=1 Tax=Tsukamurella sp. 1534 TaxID=1151061 RepID=UPI00030F59E2|nr:GNAT family N-acetyltransferase [Tsukamurella sp. 1534]
MGEFLIRAVRPADADELGAAHVAIWRAAYAGLLERAKLDALDPAASAARWRDTIIPATAEQERSGVRTRCAVHVATGRLAGFATGGTPRDEAPPRPAELWSLNVIPEFHGAGVAEALMTAAIGDRAAYLWVLRGNARAVAFYRKHGFERDGATKTDERWACTDERMVRP